MALSARSVSSFTSNSTVCNLEAALGRAPARPPSSAADFQEVVDVLQFLGQQLVVVAELQQLRVGVLQKLDRRLRPGLGVVDEGRVPSNDREIAGIVRHARREDLLAFAFGEHGGFAADDLGDLVARPWQQIVGAWASRRSRGRGR